MSQKHILVVGATGAMGQYLVPYLAEMGYKVHALALNKLDYEHPNLNSFTGNATDFDFMDKLAFSGESVYLFLSIFQVDVFIGK